MVIKASAMHTHGFGRLAAGACVVAGIRLRDTLSGRGQPSALGIIRYKPANHMQRHKPKFENFSEEIGNSLK